MLKAEKQDAGEAGEERGLLDEIAREGAQRMLMAALRAESDDYGRLGSSKCPDRSSCGRPAGF
jgi:hypothetical protein